MAVPVLLQKPCRGCARHHEAHDRTFRPEIAKYLRQPSQRSVVLSGRSVQSMMQPMRSVLTACGLVVFCAAIAASCQAPPYRLVPGWGVLPNGATWGEVPGMAIDAKGKLYAFH